MCVRLRGCVATWARPRLLKNHLAAQVGMQLTHTRWSSSCSRSCGRRSSRQRYEDLLHQVHPALERSERHAAEWAHLHNTGPSSVRFFLGISWGRTEQVRVITAKHDAEEGAAGEMRLTEPEQRPRLIV